MTVPTSLHSALFGALTMGSFAVGLLFLRFYRVGRDRFFLWFTAAFWMFSVGWGIRIFSADYTENTHWSYVPRLVGFSLILTAIIQKNRPDASTRREPRA